MSKLDYSRLRRVTDATSQPGPWRVDKHGDRYAVLDRDGMLVCDCGRDELQSKFIAAWSPDVADAVLKEIERLKLRVVDSVAEGERRIVQTGTMLAGEVSRVTAQRDAARAEIKRLRGLVGEALRASWKSDKDRIRKEAGLDV